MDIGPTLHSARASAGLGLREAARRAGTSHATLRAYETGKKTPSAATFVRILEAWGFAVDVALHQRIREHNGLRRGDELVAALELAGQFPAKAEKRMQFPRFARGADHQPA